MLEPFDTDAFIAQVQAQPSIWNYKSDAYSNRIEKSRAWEKICGVFYPNFQELCTSDKNEIATGLQRRWKSLRDSYNRELKNLKKVETGKSALKKRKYMYFDQLSFLESLALQRETTSSLQEKQEAEEGSTSEIAPPDKVATTTVTKKTGRNKRKARNEDEVVGFIPEGVNTTPTEFTGEPRDADTLFSLSLVNDLKKISEDLKSDAKCGILQVLKYYKILSSPYAHGPFGSLGPQDPRLPCPLTGRSEGTNSFQIPPRLSSTEPSSAYTSARIPSESKRSRSYPAPYDLSQPEVNPNIQPASPSCSSHGSDSSESEDTVITDLF